MMGDHLNEEDYLNLYGQENTSNKSEGWTMVVWLLCLIAAGLLLGCDGQAAEYTAIAEQEAHEKKLVLLSHPCTYVAQCGNPISDCPVSKRTCVRADLTEKTNGL